MASWLESFRDRVVQWSRAGRRRIDAAFTRRELDTKLQELGESYLGLAAKGTAPVPHELAGMVQEVRSLEESLRMQQQDIAALESEG